MANFDMEILKIEGGYSNDLDDAGQETRYGISKRSYPDLDIKNLTEEQAIYIYIRDFWNPNQLSKIQDDITAHIIFRFMVNAGANTAIKLVQTCLNSFVPIALVCAVDGVMGAVTLADINNIRAIRLQECLRLAIIKYYVDIVTKKPSQEIFLKGWIKRALL